jgi:hypothetical protein
MRIVQDVRKGNEPGAPLLNFNEFSTGHKDDRLSGKAGFARANVTEARMICGENACTHEQSCTKSGHLPVDCLHVIDCVEVKSA